MKKALSLLIACTATFSCLVSCSGGGDDASATRGIMTMQQFYSGSRQFTLNGATQLKIYATNPQSGGSHTDTRSDAEGQFVHAVGRYPVSLVYTILQQTDEGLPQYAALEITFEDTTLAQLNENQDLLSDLGLGNDGALQIMQAPIVIVLDYTTGTAYCQFEITDEGEDGGEEGDQENDVRELLFNLLIQPVGA